jgi:hypothetical protein
MRNYVNKAAALVVISMHFGIVQTFMEAAAATATTTLGPPHWKHWSMLLKKQSMKNGFKEMALLHFCQAKKVN